MLLLLAVAAALVVLHAAMLGGMRKITIVVAAAAVGFTPLVSVRITGSVTVGDALLIVAIALAALVPGERSAEGNPHLKRVRAAVWVMIFGGALGMLAVQIQAPDTKANAIAYVAATLVPLLLVAVLKPTHNELRVVIAGYGIGVLVSVGNAMTQDASLYRPTGLTPTSNHLGLTCLLGAAAWLALWVTADRFATRLIYLAAAAVCAYGVNLSGSRANLAGLGFAILLMVVFSASRRVAIAAVVAAGGLGFAILTGRINASATSGLSRLLGMGSGVDSAAAADYERQGLYNLTRDRISEHPILGSGWGNALQGHDLYMQMYAVAGVFGAVSIALLLLTTVRALLGGRSDRNRMAVIMWAGYAGYLLAGLRSNQMWDRYIWVFLVLACVTSIVGRDDATTSDTDDGADDVAELERAFRA